MVREKMFHIQIGSDNLITGETSEKILKITARQRTINSDHKEIWKRGSGGVGTIRQNTSLVFLATAQNDIESDQ